MPDLTAAQVEHMLSRAQCRNFRATFDVVQPNGGVLSFEVTMPEGELRQEDGRELEGGFYGNGLSPLSWGRFVLRMNLSPVPSLEQGKQLIVRQVTE